MTKVKTLPENILYPKKVSGRALGHYRSKIHGLRQEDVADALKMSRQAYVSWEKKEWVTIDESQAKALEKTLHVNASDLATHPEETKGPDILDHPVIKSLVSQSEYIMERVRFLEEENKRLRSAQ